MKITETLEGDIYIHTLQFSRIIKWIDIKTTDSCIIEGMD